MRIRPMRRHDIEAAEAVTAAAFAVATGSSETRRSVEAAERWRDRAAHLLGTDPGGCWVADDSADMIGVALSMRRDLLWLLSSYAVRPGDQGRGVGAALLDASIGYGAGCLRGLICALPDHRAIRRYRLAGFTPHPTMRLTGVVQRSSLPVVDGVRIGTPADRDLADSVDRRIRGAAHGADHEEMLRTCTLLVCDLLTGSGYAYVDGSTVALLAATNRSIAQRLLWAALARSEVGSEVAVRYLTADQEWAIDVAVAAGLRIERDGFLVLRHMRPPAPYVPSVSFG